MKPMINDQNRHTWCVNAHHAFRNNDGTTKICCICIESRRRNKAWCKHSR